MGNLLKKIVKIMRGLVLEEEKNSPVLPRDGRLRGSPSFGPGVQKREVPATSAFAKAESGADSLKTGVRGGLSDGGIAADFNAIYKAAGVPLAPLTADQIVQMHDELAHQGTPPEDLQRMLKVLVKIKCNENKTTLEQTCENIARRVSALNEHALLVSAKKTELTRTAKLEINSLQQEIEMKSTTLLQETQNQQQIIDSCRTESARLGEVCQLLGFNAPKGAAQGQKIS